MRRGSCAACLWHGECENDWKRRECEYFSPLRETKWLEREVRAEQRRNVEDDYRAIAEERE